VVLGVFWSFLTASKESLLFFFLKASTSSFVCFFVCLSFLCSAVRHSFKPPQKKKSQKMKFSTLVSFGLCATPILVAAAPTPELTPEDIQLQAVKALQAVEKAEAAARKPGGVAPKCNLCNAHKRKDW
jgi:hypothetical protein